MQDTWIIPCNIKYFDINTHFKISKTAVWRNAFTIHSGDTAYIYLSAPFSQIKYKCTVISDDVNEEILHQNSYAIRPKPLNNYYTSKKEKYIQLRCDYVYPDDLLTLPVLKEHGLGQVQIQARPDRRLKQYLNSVDENLGFSK